MNKVKNLTENEKEIILIILVIISVGALHIILLLNGSYYETRYEVVEISGVKFLKDNYTQQLKPIIQTNKE